ncbi:MAG: hypothetical protein ACQEQ0_02775 [Bacteroidota bacterium]
MNQRLMLLISEPSLQFFNIKKGTIPLFLSDVLTKNNTVPLPGLWWKCFPGEKPLKGVLRFR